MNRINEYIQYHVDSSRVLDIDPQVEALQYICKRFDLDIEQRCWLWNNPQAGQSPYKLFEGILRPVGKDDCKDLIYQYTGKD